MLCKIIQNYIFCRRIYPESKVKEPIKQLIKNIQQITERMKKDTYQEMRSPVIKQCKI